MHNSEIHDLCKAIPDHDKLHIKFMHSNQYAASYMAVPASAWKEKNKHGGI